PVLSIQARAAPELVNHASGAAPAVRPRWDRQQRTGRVPVTALLEGEVLGEIGPDAAAYGAESPLQISRSRRGFDQIVGIGHLGHDGRLSVDSYRKRTEGAHALDRFLLVRAGAKE